MEDGKFRILIVEDDVSYAHSLKDHLDKAFFVDHVHSLPKAEEALQKYPYHLVLLDIGLGKSSYGGFSLLSKIKNSPVPSYVVMLSGHDDSKTIQDSLASGAVDFVSKSNTFDEILERIRLIAENKKYQEDIVRLRNVIALSTTEYSFMTEDPRLLSTLSRLNYINGNEAINILITGESGVGKELIARYIHGLGSLDRPFVVVNCAALPQTLLESTLFGHKKGSFTGSTEDRIGKFELAHGGDIFLDEISTLNGEMQTRFLRVLQEGEVERVGSHHTRKIQCRVIAATNEDLDALVKVKRFRLDLYHRIACMQVTIPPLRERPQDIDLLIDHFTMGSQVECAEEVRKVFRSYPWPGNVRELKNVIKTMIALKRSGKITCADIPPQLLTREVRKPLSNEDFIATLCEQATIHGINSVAENVERSVLREALQKCTNQAECAKLLKTSPATLSRKLKEFGLK